MNLLVRFLITSIILFVLDDRPCMAALSEDQIKTAYVFNFIKFTEWPAGVITNNKITLCVAGSNSLDGALATLDGRKVEGHELHVVHYASENLFDGQPIADRTLKSCQVLFIGESEQHLFNSIIHFLDDSPVLTISDINDFAESGGCIGLLYRENKIIFEVNLASVRKSKLHLPGQLLNLSSQVFGR